MSNPERFHKYGLLPQKPVRGTPGWRFRNALWTAWVMVLFVAVLVVLLVGFVLLVAFLLREGHTLAVIPTLFLFVFALVFGSTFLFDK